jgi:hypothetical protein
VGSGEWPTGDQPTSRVSIWEHINIACDKKILHPYILLYIYIYLDI